MKLLKLNDTEPNIGSNVSVSNNVLHTLFENVKVKFNDQYDSDGMANYPYLAYLKTLLSYPGGVKNDSFRGQG